jgi:glutamyl-tRNA reductase
VSSPGLQPLEAGGLEQNLFVLGISFHTAPVEIRERFSIGESKLYPILRQLAEAPGIQEIVVLSTCNRTEFILWTEEISAAAASLENLLASEFGVRPGEEGLFYRLHGHEALVQVFRVTSSLDSLIIGEPQIVGQVKDAWTKARRAGTTGRFLDHLFQKALSVSKHVRNETAIGSAPVSVPHAAVALARRMFSTLENRSVLLLGSGKMSELSARYLLSAGVGTIRVTSRTYEHAVALARELGGTAIRFEDRFESLAASDIILSSTGCPHVILDRNDAERIRKLRQGEPVFVIDIAVPRDIDPAVREVPGFYLYDIDDLREVASGNLEGRLAAAAEAEQMVSREAVSFAPQLDAERVVPTIVALRAHLEEIRRAEVARFRSEAGSSMPGADGVALDALTTRIMDSVAGELARALKKGGWKPERDHLAAAVRHLFQLPDPGAALAPPLPEGHASTDTD